MRNRLIIAAGLLVAGCATRLTEVAGDPVLARAAIVQTTGEDGEPIGDPPRVRRSGDRYDVLLLSGGGSDGAFGAGVLSGWTASGKRPEFDVVTGVSTGALMATLAFLGPRHDDDLRRAYTEITDREVYRKRGLFGLARHGALYDRRPLEASIAQVVTGPLLDEVAREYRKGRRLYVGTTDLDAGVSLVWDMGKIASSDSPDRLRLYRQVLAASAAIPGVFQPVYIGIGGKTVMNVDGGAKGSLVFRSYMVDPARAGQNVWTIVNSHISFRGADSVAGANAPTVVGRSISEMLRTIGYRTVYRTYVIARNGNARFNLAYIPDEIAETDPIRFEPSEMRRLFDDGYAAGKAGRWQAEPPRLERLERIR